MTFTLIVIFIVLVAVIGVVAWRLMNGKNPRG
jgi:hypothetical protein